MLDPARGGVMLRKLLLRHADNPHVAIEKNSPT